ADDRIGCQRDLELLRFEPAVEQRPCGADEDIDRLDAVAAELAEAQGKLAEVPQVAEPAAPWVGRRLLQRRLQKVGDAKEHRLVLRQRLGVLKRELADFAAGKPRTPAPPPGAAGG